jgi:hypothetical protein
MTEIERKILAEKFDRDVQNRSRWKRLLLATDQWFAVLFWNASQDETISSHIYRKIQNNNATWFDKLLCKGLRKLDNQHCKKSLGE